MKPTPFCCDINSGSVEEKNEFKRLWKKIPNQEFCGFIFTYYGISKRNEYDRRDNPTTAIELFTRIIPLSEGIAILKEMVGEETKPEGDYVTLPRKLTAENGAKGLLSGEFFEEILVENIGYCGCGECGFCVEFPEEEEFETKKVPISWTTIKAIYDMVVANLQPKP